MEFLEDLPENCPIDKAKDIEIRPAYRVVFSLSPTINDFLSNAALNKRPKPPTVDDCRWASCSMFLDRSKAVNIAGKLPANKSGQRHISMCHIGVGHGLSYINKKKHIDFWPFKNFNPSKIIIKTELV